MEAEQAGATGASQLESLVLGEGVLLQLFPVLVAAAQDLRHEGIEIRLRRWADPGRQHQKTRQRGGAANAEHGALDESLTPAVLTGGVRATHTPRPFSS